MHDGPRPPLYHCLIKSWKALFAFRAVCFGLFLSGFSLAADGWTKTSATGIFWESVTSSADGSRLAAVSFGVINLSSDAGVHWIKTGVPGLRMYSVTISGDGRRLVATAGFNNAGFANLIYTSADFGSTWIPTSAPSMFWNAVALSADGSLLVASPSRDIENNLHPLYISWDSGITWIETDTSEEHWVAAACTPDGKKIMAVAQITSSPWSSKIYTSSDSGVHWLLLNNAAPALDHIAISSDGVKVVGAFEGERGGDFFFTTLGFLCTSSDSGIHWKTFEKLGSWNSVASSADGRQLMATVRFGVSPSETSAIFSSADSGFTWKDEGVAQDLDWISIAMSADGLNRVAASDPGIYTYSSLVFASSQFTNIVFYPGDSFSLDVAASGAGPISYQWQRNGTNLSDGGSLSGANAATLSVTNASAADAGNYTVIVSNAANSVTNSNALVQLTDWTFVNAAVTNFDVFAASADGRVMVGGHGPLSVSTDYGATWTSTTAPPSYWSSVSCSADGTALLATSYSTSSGDQHGSAYTSPDSGKHWRRTSLPPAGWFSGAMSADGTKLVASCELGTYYSADAGTTWTAHKGIAQLAISADGRIIGASSMLFQVFSLSKDAGATWNDVSSLPLSCHLTTSADGVHWIAPSLYSNLLYISSDSGSSWQLAAVPSATWWKAASSTSGADMVAINFSGIYASSDYGSTWRQANALTTRWDGIAITADGSTIYAAGAKGVWRSPVLPRLTVVPSPDALTLSWPAPSTNSILQQSTGLSPSYWAPVEAVPVETGHLRQITLKPSAKNTFFRLAQP